MLEHLSKDLYIISALGTFSFKRTIDSWKKYPFSARRIYLESFKCASWAINLLMMHRNCNANETCIMQMCVSTQWFVNLNSAGKNC